ncbi:MAG: D-Ala-D-Ala carboxypeptidase family metallohydrolase [bacterium]
MGNLSEHFNNKDFACRCPECRGEYKVHLGLVGALEQIGSHFHKKINIASAFWCDDFHEKQNKTKRSFHTKGKAAHIFIEGVNAQELFKYAETIPELRGLVFYPQEKFIHVDTRPGDPARTVKEGNNYNALTSDKRAKYGL